MAFICTVQGLRWHADYFQDGQASAIIVHVGYDDREEKNYYAHVGLDIIAGGELEYYFHIVEVDSYTGEERVYWYGKDISRFIKEDDRTAILNVIMNSTKMLLDQAQPPKVYRCTYESDLPEKALEKHYIISKIFCACGYKVEQTESYHGKRTWRATRR